MSIIIILNIKTKYLILNYKYLFELYYDMKLFSRRPRKNSKKSDQKPSDRKILVISGWWFRWAYALWILKVIEEKWIDQQIDAVYGVSIWAIIWSLWSMWMRADAILEILTSISIKDFYGNDMLWKSGWLVSSKKIQKMINEYLPTDFESLRIPFYAWVVDTNTARYHLFNSWDLHKIVLGSMSIPGVFPPVKYEDYSLVDGWVLNNFPVDLAKKHYPSHKVIWIALNKFQTNQKIKSALDNLQINFEVMMRSKLLENTKLVDYLFYRELPISVLSLSKKQMREAFALWYKDWLKMFWKI